MGPLGELGALFNPGMRHEIEERKSKANRREEEGNARDGDLRIDLASGVAVINLSKNGENVAPPAEDGGAQPESPTAQQDAAGYASTAGPEHTAAPSAEAVSVADEPTAVAMPGTSSLTAAQERRLAAAARRSAKGDRPVRPATPRPANAQLPSSKASRAAR